MGSQWFYKQNDKEHGPVESAALKELARNGTLQPDALIRKDGSPDWRPAGESKGLFGSPPPNSSEVQQEPENNQNPQQPGDTKATPNLTSPVGASVLVAIAAAVCLHTLQWLCGWGLGSLWGLLSTIVILTLGIIPWMLDYEGHKSAAAGFGAGVGAALGIAYGWFSGGLLSGVLFCTSISTWAAWLAERKGLTRKVAQVGTVAAALTGFHAVGMLSPATSERIAGGAASADYWYHEGFDEGELRALNLVCGNTHPITSLRSKSEDELSHMLAVTAGMLEQNYETARRQLAGYKGGDPGERRYRQETAQTNKGIRDGWLKIAAPFMNR
jgi:hypothetical protein